MIEAEKIAEGLTEAQRKRILAMIPHDRNYSGQKTGSVNAALARKGLTSKHRPIHGYWNYFKLTDLGLEVRRILQEKNND